MIQVGASSLPQALAFGHRTRVAQGFFQSLFDRINAFLADLVCTNRLCDDGEKIVNVGLLLVAQCLSMLLQYAIGFFECLGSHFFLKRVVRWSP